VSWGEVIRWFDTITVPELPACATQERTTSRLAQAVSSESLRYPHLDGLNMSHPLSIVSRVHKFVGGRIVGTPDDLGIPNLKNIYEIPADRVRSEPLRHEDNAFLQKRIAGGSLMRKALKRLGLLTSIALTAAMVVGFACMAATVGVKKGIAGIELAHAQAKAKEVQAQAQADANVKACASLLANHVTPLPPYCKN
jgi:hypothetical protein